MTVREWAREKGYDISDRGPIPREIRSAFAKEQRAGKKKNATVTQLPIAEEETAGDYPDGMTDADFTPEPEAPAPEAPEPETPGTDEQTPRAIAAPSPASKVRERVSWARKKAADGKKARRKHPRVPVDRLVTSAWTLLATAARPIPPTSRVLRVQAPVAGILLEDTVKNTAVDTFLQPLARMEQQGEVLFALAGPPMLTTVITVNPQAAPFLMPVLRESLILLCKTGGPRVAEAMARGAADEATYGPQVDAMMAMMFAAPPGSEDEAAQQEQAMADAQAFIMHGAEAG